MQFPLELSLALCLSLVVESLAEVEGAVKLGHRAVCEPVGVLGDFVFRVHSGGAYAC